MFHIDLYSYRCGVIDCFNEMLHAGLKRIALSHPEESRESQDSYLEFSNQICQKYGTRFYPEDSPLLTDLFPLSMNLGKYNIIYYRSPQALEEYLKLKKKKERLMREGRYTGQERYLIAAGFGSLLSYPEDAIRRLIAENQEKEPD